jgi:hypothetical protein
MNEKLGKQLLLGYIDENRLQYLQSLGQTARYVTRYDCYMARY